MLLNCLNKFKLTHQICCEIVFVCVLHMLIAICFIASAIALVNLHLYKDDISHLDVSEFSEMTSLGNLLENSQIIFEASYMDYAAILALMFESISIKNIFKTTPHSKLSFESYSAPDQSKPSLSKIVYWNKASTSLNETAKRIFEDMSIYLSQIHNEKIFGFKDKDNKYFEQMFFIDIKNNYLCAYPGDLSDFNTNIDLNVIKQYIKDRIAYRMKIIASLSKVFPRHLKYVNLTEFPFYEEEKPFPELYLTKDTIQVLSFAIVKDDYNNDPANLDFSKVFLVIGKTSSINIMDKSIIETTNEIQILKTQYYYPYELTNREICFYIRNLNLMDNDSDLITTTQDNVNSLNYLEDCFSNTAVENYKSNKEHSSFTYKQLFTYSMNLYDKLSIEQEEISADITSTPTEYIQMKEQKRFEDSSTAFNQTINSRMLLNNKMYKIKKFYSPFSITNLVNYYYPKSNIHLNFIIKNEGLTENVSNDIKLTMLTMLINCVMWTYIIYLCILLFIGIRLNKVVKGIQKIINQINNLISGNHFEETNVDEHIHEFDILIEMIDKMIKGDLDLKQSQNQKEEIRRQFNINKFNKEFTFVESNIEVKEDDIYNLIDNSNESFSILNNPIQRMESDSFVKDSAIFKDIVGKIVNNINKENNEKNNSKSKEIREENNERKENVEDSSISDFLISSRSLQYEKNALYNEGLELNKEIQEACIFFK